MFFSQSPVRRATHGGISSVNSRVARTVKVFRSSLNLSLKQSGLLLPNAQHSQLTTISETKWTNPILPKAQQSQLSTDAPNLPMHITHNLTRRNLLPFSFLQHLFLFFSHFFHFRPISSSGRSFRKAITHTGYDGRHMGPWSLTSKLQPSKWCVSILDRGEIMENVP